jgi:hypothetical protein
MSNINKIIIGALLFTTQSLPLWAQTTAPTAVRPATAAARPTTAKPAPTTERTVADRQLVNSTQPTVKQPVVKPVDQDKALWGGWVPLPKLDFKGF